MSKKLLGLDVATALFDSMCEELEIPVDKFSESEKDESTKDRLVNAFASGRLEFTDGVFHLKLLKPIKSGEKDITFLNIEEPDGVQLRATADVKKANDDVGKGQAVLAAVTGHGMPTIGKLKSRDLMVAVEVIGLFL